MSIPMINSVGNISAIRSSAVENLERSHATDKVGGLPAATPDKTQLNTFSQALADARGLDADASEQAVKFANNDPSVGIHEVMIASEKANIAVRYATTMKNKALEAYHELMATQV